MKSQTNSIVIGLGTGRCGTVSLSKFLSAQAHCAVTHEGGGPPPAKEWVMPWEPDAQKMHRFIDTVIAPRFDHDVVISGDVASYYLPYVDALLRDFDQCDIKFVCLKRDRTETVKSFAKWTEANNQNHWMAHDGDHWKLNPTWDAAYPTYDSESKEQALGRYWDDYYSESQTLEARYPDRFRIFSIDTLNSPDGQEAILTFLQLPDELQVRSQSVHHNQSPTALGQALRKNPLLRKLNGLLKSFRS